MLLMIDNYDSFTYNLVQYFGELGEDISVYRNDTITIERIKKLRPRKIVISPGPGRPESAGISNALISEFKGSIPILGVCLGHQCIGEVFGGRIVRAARLMHGKTSEIFHDHKHLFEGLPEHFSATRYHSLVVEKETLPDCLQISAWTENDEIMGIRHNKYLIEGIQFHPESILTFAGKDILRNFLKMSELFWESRDGRAINNKGTV
ncbi:MAG: aminodeoxychorismate/anthranilate synthase component II [Proteobacteria bacterium]|nr:aminodeoxychorismate/anthranilate synthase component II [Pseudomonadota bacterium]